MLGVRGLRLLAYGLVAVLIGIALADEGFSPVAQVHMASGNR
jgi:hypothetical protein